MTTDRAKELVNDAFGAWYSEYANTKYYNEDEAKEAHDTAIKALDEVEKYRKAIEGIKTEITSTECAYSFSIRSDSLAFAHGLELALEIINKHLKGAEENGD